MAGSGTIPTKAAAPAAAGRNGAFANTIDKLRFIARCWRPHRIFLVFLALFTLVSSAVAVGYPLALKFVIDGLDRALRSGERASPWPLLGALALIGLGRLVAGFYPAFRAWMNLRIEADVRAETFARILEKDLRFQRAFRTGDVVTRLTDDIGEYPKLAWFCCSGIFRAVDSGSKVLLSLAGMFCLDFRLALISMIPLPVMLYVIYRTRRRLTERFEAQQQAISRTNDFFEAAFCGIRILKAFAAESGQSRKLDAILRERIGIQMDVTRLQALIQAVDAFASRAGQVVAIALGGLMVAEGELALGTLYAFYVYLDLLVHPIQDLPNLIVTARQAFVSIDRIEELRRFPAPEPPPAEATSPPFKVVQLRAVTCAYEEGRTVLDAVSLELRRGERVAVVGAVGSGKTTLIRLLAGLVRPVSGEILLDGRPLADLRVPGFRRRLGYVPQESLLFGETILENVTLGEPVDPEHVRRCFAVAQLEEDLARLENGLQTQLGERGGLISGGQKARIAVARALARRPELLLLDDSTAALDAHTEERFWTSLEREFPDLTTLVTSHRLATVRRADRVIYLERGRVRDEGRHEELLARSAQYRDLLAAEVYEESRTANMAIAR